MDVIYVFEFSSVTSELNVWIIFIVIQHEPRAQAYLMKIVQRISITCYSTLGGDRSIAAPAHPRRDDIRPPARDDGEILVVLHQSADITCPKSLQVSDDSWGCAEGLAKLVP